MTGVSGVTVGTFFPVIVIFLFVLSIFPVATYMQFAFERRLAMRLANQEAAQSDAVLTLKGESYGIEEYITFRRQYLDIRSNKTPEALKKRLDRIALRLRIYKGYQAIVWQMEQATIQRLLEEAESDAEKGIVWKRKPRLTAEAQLPSLANAPATGTFFGVLSGIAALITAALFAIGGSPPISSLLLIFGYAAIYGSRARNRKLGKQSKAMDAFMLIVAIFVGLLVILRWVI
jgi:hypothetical protein